MDARKSLAGLYRKSYKARSNVLTVQAIKPG